MFLSRGQKVGLILFTVGSLFFTTPTTIPLGYNFVHEKPYCCAEAELFRKLFTIRAVDQNIKLTFKILLKRGFTQG
jgi:hypothetical protein